MNRIGSPGRLLGAVALAVLMPAAAPVHALEFDPTENVSVVAESFTDQGLPRRVVYLHPTMPSAAGRVPAVVLLHYLRGDAQGMSNLAGAARLVRDYGIWVVLPEGYKGIWNSSAGATRVSPQDDVAFLAKAIDRAVAKFPLDPRRIYMAGYSDGGHMAELFACQRPEKIAALSLVAAAIHSLDATLCAPGLPTPIQFIRGSADTLVPYDGDNFYKSAAATAALWAGINGCSSPALTSNLPDTVPDDGTTVRLDAYRNCSSGDPVELYTAANAGHTWAGALGFSTALGRTSQDIDATVTMWQFMQQYSRP